MGFGLRIFFIDKDNKIKKIPLSRFEKIRNRDKNEIHFEYKDSRIRYAEVVVELERRKPVSITRIVYGYLQFDSNGQVDKKHLDLEAQAAMRMLPSLSLPGESGKVINASDKFAQQRFKHEFSWTPSKELKEAIITKVFD